MFNDQRRLRAWHSPLRLPQEKPPRLLWKDAPLERRPVLEWWIIGGLFGLCVNSSVHADHLSRGAIGGRWWMCPGSLDSIYQKISTDLWVVWAALGPSAPTLTGISIRGHCAVSGGYGDGVLYLVVPQHGSEEVQRLEAVGFVTALGVSDSSSVSCMKMLLSTSNS